MNIVETRWLGRITWQSAYELQEQLVQERLEGKIADTLLLLEHEPVITIGRTPDRTSLMAAEMQQIPVIETNRGGQATYHGPGQLVAYLIYDLTCVRLRSCFCRSVQIREWQHSVGRG
jgi:lipoyl(octanoyl) transferase